MAGYRVLERIAGHGQGEVYLAEDPQGRRVALKRWKLPSPRAARELEALARLSTPGIVRVLGSAEDEALGLPCLIMEHVEGAPLLGDGERLPPREAARLARDVAVALAEVHAAGLVHRDVKPANVLVRPSGAVVLVDFGVVKDTRGGPDVGLTASGAAPVGTLPYMSPEQLGLIAQEPDTRCDVYGLGATLYQCLTGAVPFETDGAFERQQRDVWRDPRPGARIDGVPADLRELVRGCLAFRPEERVPDMRELARRLQACVERRGPGWRAAAAVALGGAALLAATQDWSGVISEEPPVVRAAEAAPVHELLLQPGPLDGVDTYVSGVGLYRNDNFGVEPLLRVGSRPASSGQAGEYRSFLRFDLSRLPPQAELEEARLELYCIGEAHGRGLRELELAQVVESLGGRTPWREGTGGLDRTLDGMAWDGAFRATSEAASSALPALSQPESGPPLARAVPSSQAWCVWDARAAVAAWLAGAPNHGLRLAAGPAASAEGAWVFASSDALEVEQRPRLRLRYRGPAPAPAAPPDVRRALRAAATRLREAKEHERAGDPQAALRALSAAASAAPCWGRPFLARAQLAARVGYPAGVRVDLLRALGVERPALTAEGLELLADASLAQPGARPQLEGLLLLAALALDGAELDGATRAERFCAALSARGSLLGALERGELRDALCLHLAEVFRALLRADPRDGAPPPGVAVAQGIILQLRGEDLPAAAKAAARAHPALGACARLSPQTPSATAARLRLMLFARGPAATRAAAEAACARWPEERALAALRDALRAR
ncbi:MAG: protein kinase [Planctomycetota bacterium]